MLTGADEMAYVYKGSASIKIGSGKFSIMLASTDITRLACIIRCAGVTTAFAWAFGAYLNFSIYFCYFMTKSSNKTLALTGPMKSGASDSACWERA